MLTKVKKSLSKINYKLFLALLVLGLVPTIYTTVRVFFLGQLPGEYSFSIAGQLSWVNLLYEILSESIVLPLFFFIGKVLTDKNEFYRRKHVNVFFFAECDHTNHNKIECQRENTCYTFYSYVGCRRVDNRFIRRH